MKRKISILTLSAMLVALCPAAEAQQPKKVPRIGYLATGDAASASDRAEAIRLALGERGHIDGQNIAIEYRYAEGKLDRLPALAAELVHLKVDIIVVTGGDPDIRAVKNATKTIPIIMMGAGTDPVEAGFIDSLARPGGNVTGLTNLAVELGGKRLELLKEAVPKLVRVAVLYERALPSNILQVKELLPPAAHALELTMQPWEVRAADDFERVFAALSKQRPDGLLVLQGSLMGGNGKRIAGFAIKSRVPSIGNRGFVDAGGLMSYGADLADSYRRVAYFVDRILKGAKPADLPVEQPTKFELAINMKTAKQIGVTIPQSLLYRADRVIKITFWIFDFRFWIESQENKPMNAFSSKSLSDNRKSKIQNRKLAGIVSLVVTFAMWAVVASAQQTGKILRIGYLDNSTASGSAVFLEAFRQELSKLGWIEGKNITIEYRFAEQKLERLPELAADLVRLKVDLIVTSGGPTPLAVKGATSTIPIVMTSSPDPVGEGLVASLARPGGNVTGLASLGPELNTKRLEILKDAVPRLTRVGILRQEGENTQWKEIRPAAIALKLKLEEIVTQPDAKGLESAFKTAKQKQVGAIMTPAGRRFGAERKRIVELAVKYRLPAIYAEKGYVDEGGLMSYGVDYDDLFRRAAGYVDKILKGAKPADLPVQQATKFEFIINLKAAKQIGLTLSPDLLARANKVVK